MRPLIRVYVVKPNDSRGWIGLGCYGLVLVILAMIAVDKSLLENNAFLVLATAIVITGWNQGPVGWAFQATKSGGEAAESSARIAEEAATAAIKSTPKKDVPQSAAEGAEKTAEAAVERAEEIREEARK